MLPRLETNKLQILNLQNLNYRLLAAFILKPWPAFKSSMSEYAQKLVLGT